jgi:Tfp pilus assembly protein PilF
MSEPLPLIDQLLAKVRQLHQLGCLQEAQRLLTRLAGFRTLTEAATVEVRTRLARLLLRQRRFGAARSHLTAVLKLRPRHAFTHYLLAHATHARGRGNLARAADHARRAAESAPHRPRYWVTHGTLLLRQGQADEGVACLGQALALAGDDVRVVARVVRALCRAGQWREARRVVQTALFRRPRCPILAKLWGDVRFQEARGRQERRRRQREQQVAGEEGPRLLPFVRPQPAGLGFRLDGASSLPAPHFPRAPRFSDQKKA